MSLHQIRSIRLNSHPVAFRRGSLEVIDNPSGFVLDFESAGSRVITAGQIEVETIDGRTFVARAFDPSPAERRHRLVNVSHRHGWRSASATTDGEDPAVASANAVAEPDA